MFKFADHPSTSANEPLKYMNGTKNEFRYGEKIISHYDLTNIQGTRLLRTSEKSGQYVVIVTLNAVSGISNQTLSKRLRNNMCGTYIHCSNAIKYKWPWLLYKRKLYRFHKYIPIRAYIFMCLYLVKSIY